ncbi:hypothetical protein ACFOFO_02940, partial [Undibacterium arcticum]
QGDISTLQEKGHFYLALTAYCRNLSIHRKSTSIALIFRQFAAIHGDIGSRCHTSANRKARRANTTGFTHLRLCSTAGLQE